MSLSGEKEGVPASKMNLSAEHDTKAKRMTPEKTAPPLCKLIAG